MNNAYEKRIYTINEVRCASRPVGRTLTSNVGVPFGESHL